jgi:hypothetical protein
MTNDKGRSSSFGCHVASNVAPEFGVREMSGGREMGSPCPHQVVVVPCCCSIVVWLLVVVEVGPTMTNDDCRSSFGCHVTYSDVATAACV